MLKITDSNANQTTYGLMPLTKYYNVEVKVNKTTEMRIKFNPLILYDNSAKKLFICLNKTSKNQIGPYSISFK